MDFSEALIKLKEGKQVYRTGWNGIKAGKTMYLVLKEGYNDYGVYNHPRIDMIMTTEVCKGWVPWGLDLFAQDWEIMGK